MRLFKKSSQPWPPSWTYDAGTYIWRFVFTGEGGILGEARDPVKKTTSFFCIGEADGSPRWEGLRVNEDWWVGLETVDTGRFYLHGYRKPDMPQHLGIRAFDVRSGEALWANDELTFVLARGGEVYAAREGFSGIDFFRLSPEDGSVIEELGQDIERINTLRQLLNEEDDFSGYRYPEAFTEMHPAFAASTDAVRQIVDPSQVVGNLDVLVEPPVVLAAWHEAIEANGSRPVLRQKFQALHLPSGRTLFKDVLLDEADAPGMDSFFLKDGQLLYIRNRCILTAHHLNGVPA